MGKKSKNNQKSKGSTETNTTPPHVSNHSQENTVELPFVSVICVTFNRRPFFKMFFECLRYQTYPSSRFEIIIVDDGTDKIQDLVETCSLPNIRYFPIQEKMTLGKKRNYSHTLVDTRCKYIIYFDDDDWASSHRIQHSVEMLEKHPEAMIAGSSELYVYFKHIQQMWQFGPYQASHCTAGTMCFRKSMLDNCQYENTACLAEERYFLKNYTIPMVQLNPLKTILVFSHLANTFDKKKLIEQGESQYQRSSKRTFSDFITCPEEETTIRFFMDEMDVLLSVYEPGRPENKPDVIQQTKEIEEERKQILEKQRIQQQQQQQHMQMPQIMMNRPGMEPQPLTPENIVQLIQQQQQQIEQMTRYIKMLEEKLKKTYEPRIRTGMLFAS
jgi:Glycosyl transferase family 2